MHSQIEVWGAELADFTKRHTGKSLWKSIDFQLGVLTAGGQLLGES